MKKAPHMNYSSVVITLAAGAEAEAGVLETLSCLGGLEIHHVDSSSRRAVGVIEAATTDREADIFERIRCTPGVIDVSLVAHYFEDEAK